MTPNVSDWAKAIALRIADEWSGDDADDRQLLFSALVEAFTNAPDVCMRLVGTQVIEEDYFDALG